MYESAATKGDFIMERERLKKADGKYWKMDIPEMKLAYMYADMKALFIFIGSHYDHGKNEAIGNAYVELIRRTDVKLKVTQWWYRGKLKTSKREIRAFIMPKAMKEPMLVQVRIPYKAYYIMGSIVDCVNELIEMNVEIPIELKKAMGKLYRDAFYYEQIKLYESDREEKKREWEEDEFIAWYLHDDFFSPVSPFARIFDE